RGAGRPNARPTCSATLKPESRRRRQHAAQSTGIVDFTLHSDFGSGFAFQTPSLVAPCHFLLLTNENKLQPCDIFREHSGGLTHFASEPDAHPASATNGQENMGKALGIIVAVVLVAIIVFFGFQLIDVDQTEEGALPDVDVAVEGGNIPEYDVDVGEVVVGTTEEQVEVPDVDVEMEETTVDVPVIGIEEPEADDEEDPQDPER
ncbi:hypothetical protein, partial [Maricaulis sp. CAU 1757]